ncbi:SdpA family antimicrobial peptide system protein [Rhodococcoides fascians]|uniref:SdpA family antimicrobial peptide system protein n=1 Tax=Rhodococcoides fascians TaxID=1828 RepID=UPI0018AFE669|nr:SdpA family antimicrobial peptide system protein [Rhodococcus fascians]
MKTIGEQEFGHGDETGSVRTGLVFVMSMTVLTALFGAAVFFSLPANLLWTPTTAPGVSTFFATRMPEKWGFFTKDPQSSQYGAYRLGSTESLLSTPQALPRNAFGLSRTQRAQGAELAILGHQATWTDCNDYLDSCIDRATDVTTIESSTRTHTVCGEVLLTEEKLIPWSFREQSRQDQPWVLRTAQIRVQC